MNYVIGALQQKLTRPPYSLIQLSQILALFLLRSFALYIAPYGIADFRIAQAKHCNHVLCSFVLRID